MKSFPIIFSFCLLSFVLQAQEQKSTNPFDHVFRNVNKVDATTGILYERVIPFAQLHKFNSKLLPVDTSNCRHFFQAYLELYKANFLPVQNYFPFDVDSLKSLISNDTKVVDIGILHFRFNTMDSAVAYQKLYFDADSVLHEDSTISVTLFVERTAFVASPLNKKVDIGTTTFRFKNLFRFDNTGNPILSLLVDFDDGNGLQTITDSLQTVTYTDGKKTLYFEALLTNGDTLISYSTINCFSPFRGNPNNKSGWQYIDSISFTGNNAIKAKIATSYDSEFTEKAKGEVWIYYAKSGNSLSKPILIVDGFDPENNRNFESHKKEDEYPDVQSIWALLGNGLSANQNVGKQLLQKGYDLVILDLPEGGTYIERNAMVCIEVINKINSLLVQSGSKEEIVVVGPSMGGQITRYALAYMENPDNHNANTNCFLNSIN